MILGYSILFLLCLCILIVCLLLFVPFRYVSDGFKNEEAFSVHFRISYLRPLFTFKVLHSSEEHKAATKICGISLKIKDKESSDESDEKSDLSAKKDKVKKKKKKRKGSFIKDIDYYVSLWQDHKELILDVLKTILKALSTIMPTEIKGKVVFGTGMADVTGFVYALYCVVETYLPDGVTVEPLWLEKHLEGEYKLKGKVRLFPLLVALIKIYSNENVRILYKKIRRV